MEVILDTNALSAFADGAKRLERLLANVEWIWIPTIVLGEYRFGIIQSNRRQDYEDWLEIVATPDCILSTDAMTAKIYAETRLKLKKVGKPIPYHDIWISALAIQHDLPIFSEDRHFDFLEEVTRIGWK